MNTIRSMLNTSIGGRFGTSSRTNTSTGTSPPETPSTGGGASGQQIAGRDKEAKVKMEMKSVRGVHYEELALIAKSGQGQAWKGIAVEGTEGTAARRVEVVVKILHAPFISCGAAKYTLRELVLLSTLKHPNLISLYDIRVPIRAKKSSLKKFDELHFVMEYCGRTLAQRIEEKRAKGTVWSHQELAYCSMQILCAVNFLHQSGIQHRDLKPQNVVVNNQGQVKVLDYGIARDIIPDNMTPDAGTPFYRAPEIFLGIDSYDNKVDIWSIGCIFAELILGRVLFTGTTMAEQWKNFVRTLGSPTDMKFLQKYNIKEKHRICVDEMEKFEPVDWEQFLPDNAAPKLVNDSLTMGNVRQLVSGMLALDPAKRLDAATALKNAYFDIYRGFLCANLLTKPDPQCAEQLKTHIEKLRTKGGNDIEKWKEIVWDKINVYKESTFGHC